MAFDIICKSPELFGFELARAPEKLLGLDRKNTVIGKARWKAGTKTIQTKDERANLVYAIKILVKNDGYLKIGMYGDVRF